MNKKRLQELAGILNEVESEDIDDEEYDEASENAETPKKMTLKGDNGNKADLHYFYYNGYTYVCAEYFGKVSAINCWKFKGNVSASQIKDEWMDKESDY